MRVCPDCGKWFGLQFISTEKDNRDICVKVFRCKKCGKEYKFAAEHPPGAV